MRWIVEIWSRLTHRSNEPAAPSPADLSRDPDLDVIHREQHDLISRSGYASARTRESWDARVRDSWRPLDRGTR